MIWVLFERTKEGNFENIIGDSFYTFRELTNYVKNNHDDLVGKALYAESYVRKYEDALRWRKLILYTKTTYWIPTDHKLEPIDIKERKMY